MKTYYARSKNSDGKMETVEEHLKAVEKLCSDFLSPISYFDWGALMGSLHDFGKLSDSFDEVLQGKRERVNHALAGAAVAHYMHADTIASVIASHHSDLMDFTNYLSDINKSLHGDGDRLDKNNRYISVFGTDEIRNALTIWGQWFKPNGRRKMPDFSASEDEELSEMLFTRLLYSALVDADWSASAQHFEPDYLEKHSGSALDAQAALDRLLDIRRSKQKSSKAVSKINKLRDDLFDACLEAGKQPSGLYTLTAPTGMGKTLALMAFALQHCITHKKRRIFLILPYLSIIEQNSKDYREIVPDLLEIHSHIPQDEENRNLSERWDAPCIVTTNVSFFEPLFSSKAGSCRHLHQLTDSVIVLDEAQTLPQDLLDSTLRTLKELCRHYGCTVLLSTATQPSFNHRPTIEWSPNEIVPNPAQLFSNTSRVKWEWRLSKPNALENIADEMSEVTQCCAIVNKRKHARKLFDSLKGKCEQDGLFYLTTDLCPAHRTDILNEIRARLQDGRPCRLVATQCVEAGVDIDFPKIFRALAPLDSLIQAAGRCNRNGRFADSSFIVFIPDEDGELYPSNSYKFGAECVRYLPEHPDDPCNPAYIDEYYRRLYKNCDGDKDGLKKALSSMDYVETDKEYRIIPNAGVQVIVPYKEKIELFNEIRSLADENGLTAEIIRAAREITVSSFDLDGVQRNCTALLPKRKYEESTKSTGYYILGYDKCYDDSTGLRFDVDFNGLF